jgi:hypothetical protein
LPNREWSKLGCVATFRFAFIVFALLNSATACFASVELSVGKTAYVVASPKSTLEKKKLDQLSAYLSAVLHKDPAIVSSLSSVPPASPAIVLALKGETNPLGTTAPESPEGFGLVTGKSEGRPVIVAVGNTDLGLKRAVQTLVIKSRQNESGLEIPDLNLTEKPWIPQREWALCPWVPWNVRGTYVNPYVDQRGNIYKFSERQQAKYVEMFDWFGYNGTQLIEASLSWSYFGSMESYHDQLKKLARMARENGHQVTFWVWAAQFNDYGWVDTDLVYKPSAGQTAFDDPQVRKGFEKYYDHYAEMAPLVDRLIGHFYDPGQLSNRQDVFSYMRLLESKFKAKNPKIKMSIDMWAANPGYFDELVKNGFKDYLILENSLADYVPVHPDGAQTLRVGNDSITHPAMRAEIHEKAKQLGLSLGLWGWYDTEYETDQQASMYVNGQLLKSFVQEVKNGAAKIHPLEYWSEMDANHLNNLCSMYIAAQLLWNPERDPDELMAEFAEGVWGPRNGPKVLKALKLIEDVRTGPNWDTYWWTMSPYRRGTSDPAEDLKRVESILADLQSLKPDQAFVPKFPVPVSGDTLVDMMLPYLRQIRDYAEFRIELDGIKAAWKSGASKDDISQRLAKAWKPIPEYDTWIGVFGQTERRMQEIQLRKFAKEAGVKLEEPSWLRAQDAGRLLQKIQNVQRQKKQELDFKISDLNEFMWTDEKLNNRFEKLIADGWVIKVSENTYRLVNWPDYVH